MSTSLRPPTAVVVGTVFGARVHVRALRLAGFEVAGLVGRDLEQTAQRAALAEVPNAFGSLGDALALHPDVVAIATPPPTHAPLSTIALEHGCHVVCEKPFTIDAAEAEALAVLAAERGLVAYIGHEFRFTESAALIERLLAQGVIGDPRLATFIAHGSLWAEPNPRRPAWWSDRALGGGWLGASGSHGVDRIRSWFGAVESVSARLVTASARGNNTTADDSFDIRFTTVTGVVGVIQSTAAAFGPPFATTRIVGSEGTLWIDDESGRGTVESAQGRVMVADRQGVRPIEVPDDLVLRGREGIEPSLARNVAPFARLYEHLRAAMGGRLLTSGPTPATFADGVANMRILDAVRASAAHGGEVCSVAVS